MFTLCIFGPKNSRGDGSTIEPILLCSMGRAYDHVLVDRRVFDYFLESRDDADNFLRVLRRFIYFFQRTLNQSSYT